MSIKLVSIITPCRYTEFGLKELIKSIFPDTYVIHLKVKSAGFPNIKESQIRDLGNHTYNLISNEVNVDLISFSAKDTIEKISKTITSSFESEHINDLKTVNKIKRFSSKRKRIWLLLFAGLKPLEISEKLELPPSYVLEERNEIFRSIGVSRTPDLVKAFNKSLTIVFKE